MSQKGVKNFIEIGPGKVLTGMVKRTLKDANSLINQLLILKILRRFKNKKVIITGATGGIGNSLVEKFNNLGATIMATGTNEDKLKSLKNIKILILKN